MAKKKTKIVVIIASALVLCALAAGIFLATANSPERKLAGQLELGQKYLEELDYENAIVAYQAAIEIDPRQEEAYRGLAQAYEAMGDYQAAVDIMKQGVAETKSEGLTADLVNLYLEMGEKYLGEECGPGESAGTGESDVSGETEDSNRSRAISAYLAAIETDPGCVEAYRRLVELYMSAEDYQAAVDILKRGIDAAGSEELEGELTALRQQLAEGITRQFKNGSYRITEYTQDGIIVKLTYYNADGTVGFYNEYNSSGGMVKHTSYGEDRIYVQEYDGGGNMLTEAHYRFDWTMMCRFEFEKNLARYYEIEGNGGVEYLAAIDEYDDDGNIVRFTGYTPGGTKDWVTEYDSNGNVAKQIAYNEDGTLQWTSIHERSGNIEKGTYYDADGTLVYYWTAEYDADGNEVWSTYYNADGTLRE